MVLVRDSWAEAATGVLSAAVTVGVGEALAAFVRPEASPVIAVGNRVVLLTPESAKRATIDSVGTADKTLLLGAIYVLLALAGVFIGRLARRDLRAGVAAVLVLGAFASWCALTASAGEGRDVIPSVGGTVAGAAVLVTLVRAARRRDARGEGPNRRTFLLAAGSSAALAAVAGFGGRAAQHARFDVAAARRRVRLPAAAGPTAVPAGAELGRSSVPWATPSSRFYRIDTALTVPQVDPDSWRLHVFGAVDRELTLTFADLLARPQISRWITLCCVSNGVGGSLVGNALWQGVRLADLLRECGIAADADQLLLTSVDGFSFGAPTAVVMDGRDALLAVGMNGRPLPLEHGFPVRTVVPGLYGYVSACKWITSIKATSFQDEPAYWVQQGWAARPAIKLASRIDTPRPGRSVTAGETVTVAGVAWDQHVGVSKVEVQVDDGPWRPARLAAVPSTDTWRQWVFEWRPERTGSVRLQVRATDARGVRQDEHRAAAFPDGATGLHEVSVQVTA